MKFGILSILGFPLLCGSWLTSCHHQASSQLSAEAMSPSVKILFSPDGISPGESFDIPEIDDFHPEPLRCDAYHSKEYDCDGYTQKNLPSGPGSANPTPEIETSSAPPSGYIGLQSLTRFDPNRPSVIYIHGWNVEQPDHVFGLPDQWVQQARKAGFNVFQFPWAVPSFDKGKGCPGPGWLGLGNVPCNAALAYFKAGGATDYFLKSYMARFKGVNQPVRLVFQSLAASFGIYVTWRMYHLPEFQSIRKPNRLDIIDPFVMPGFGEDRSVAYNGQIPPDDTLPDEYRQNIVKEFVPGSGCTTKNFGPIKANALSQYCQSEGMAYQLVRDFNVGILTLSSIVGGLSARDFKRISAFQAFSGSAFGGKLTTRHTAPNASYFYSFAPGTPPNAWDASTPDQDILDASKRQIEGKGDVRLQTSGLDTITLMDDEYSIGPL